MRAENGIAATEASAVSLGSVVARPPLKVAWLLPPDGCAEPVAITLPHTSAPKSAPKVIYRYHCALFSALAQVTVSRVVHHANGSAILDAVAFRRSADVMVLPYVCSNGKTALTRCNSLLLANDAPILFFLNKMFDVLDYKLKYLQRIAKRVALVIMPVPHAPVLEKVAGVRMRFLPYAGEPQAFGAFQAWHRYGSECQPLGCMASGLCC